MKVHILLTLVALGCGGIVLLTRAGGAQRSPAWIEPPALPRPVRTCSEPAAHALDRADVAERAAREHAEVYALRPSAGLTARARFAEASACATVAGDAARAERIARTGAAFEARLEREYARHVERYRLARRAQRSADAQADIGFLEALWSGPELAQHPQRASLLEQLQSDRVPAPGDRS